MIKVLPFKTAFIAGKIHNQEGMLEDLGSRDKIKTVRKITTEIIQIKRL